MPTPSGERQNGTRRPLPGVLVSLLSPRELGILRMEAMRRCPKSPSTTKAHAPHYTFKHTNMHCGKRPKFVEGTRVHDYCGRTCAVAAGAVAAAAAPSQATPAEATPVTVPSAAGNSTAAGPQPGSNGPTVSDNSPDLCIVCGKRPKYNDGVRIHDYCGKSCAAKGMSGNASAVTPAANASATANTTGATDLCKVASAGASVPAELTNSPHGLRRMCTVDERRLRRAILSEINLVPSFCCLRESFTLLTITSNYRDGRYRKSLKMRLCGESSADRDTTPFSVLHSTELSFSGRISLTAGPNLWLYLRSHFLMFLSSLADPNQTILTTRVASWINSNLLPRSNPQLDGTEILRGPTLCASTHPAWLTAALNAGILDVSYDQILPLSLMVRFLNCIHPTQFWPSALQSSVEAMQANLCIFCGKYPKRVEGNRTHDYCGRTCVTKAQAANHGKPLNQSGLCIVCGLRPRFKEGNKTHDYCGRSCAAKGKTSNDAVVPNGMCKLCKTRPVHGAYMFCSRTCGQKACIACKCKPRFQDPSTGITHNYCGRTCAHQDMRDRNMTSNTDSAVVPLNNPGIEELAQGTRDHQSIVDQFRASWRHPTPCPVIKKIYRIRGKPSAVSAYEAYRANLESVGHFTSQNKNMTEGNEERRWHGSTKAQSEPVYLETLAKQICAQLQPALFVASFVTPSTCPVSAALMEEAGQYISKSGSPGRS
ncbi:hypothetical protein EVG20_g3799 [Dentipellis fragilis]|uniref:Uncharacterized protein n=1 Tax=Dentipellis fragilis TaxID=205917 RepID=A0A4Y9Z1V5_9AGAM|nr:hypothetical protein EVG20_g3799 [Dentipellis fragilis]